MTYVVQPYNKSVIVDMLVGSRIIDIDVGDDTLYLVIERNGKLKQVKIEIDESRDPRHEAVMFISEEDI